MHASILLTGEAAVQLLSKDGEVLSVSEIPAPPVARPVIGDFDNDGVTDIVLVTDDAILGYHLKVEKATNALLVVLVILSLIAAVVFLSNIQSVPLSAEGSTTVEPLLGSHLASWASKAGRKTNSSILRVLRSTDEHLD
jgi:hypothetical protein